jgi:hypothetical protein
MAGSRLRVAVFEWGRKDVSALCWGVMKDEGRRIFVEECANAPTKQGQF